MKDDAIRLFMTSEPHTIGKKATLQEAHALMWRAGVRHLPVVEEGRLVGLVSMRDLHLVETFPDVDRRNVSVEDAMSTGPFAVSPSAPLARTVRSMARKKIGAALVVERGIVRGIFTTSDALRVLAIVLSLGDGAKKATPAKGPSRRKGPLPAERRG